MASPSDRALLAAHLPGRATHFIEPAKDRGKVEATGACGTFGFVTSRVSDVCCKLCFRTKVYRGAPDDQATG